MVRLVLPVILDPYIAAVVAGDAAAVIKRFSQCGNPIRPRQHASGFQTMAYFLLMFVA
jgi:hypothetical protein